MEPFAVIVRAEHFASISRVSRVQPTSEVQGTAQAPDLDALADRSPPRHRGRVRALDPRRRARPRRPAADGARGRGRARRQPGHGERGLAGAAADRPGRLARAGRHLRARDADALAQPARAGPGVGATAPTVCALDLSRGTPDPRAAARRSARRSAASRPPRRHRRLPGRAGAARRCATSLADDLALRRRGAHRRRRRHRRRRPHPRAGGRPRRPGGRWSRRATRRSSTSSRRSAPRSCRSSSTRTASGPTRCAGARDRAPAAVVLQPRAHNPTGVSMTRERAQRAGRGSSAGSATRRRGSSRTTTPAPSAPRPDVSLGAWLPERVVHVRSFSKSHGPDLRIAALGGPAAMVDRLVARRMLGPGWTSRMLQTILLDLLTELPLDGRGRRGPTAVLRPAADARRARWPSTASTSPPPTASTCGCRWPTSGRRCCSWPPPGIRAAAGSPFLAAERSEPPHHVRVTDRPGRPRARRRGRRGPRGGVAGLSARLLPRGDNRQNHVHAGVPGL